MPNACNGGARTFAGLVFISPEIRSLMSEYFKVIGMFMGALGGLFAGHHHHPRTCPGRLYWITRWCGGDDFCLADHRN